MGMLADDPFFACFPDLEEEPPAPQSHAGAAAAAAAATTPQPPPFLDDDDPIFSQVVVLPQHHQQQQQRDEARLAGSFVDNYDCAKKDDEVAMFDHLWETTERRELLDWAAPGGGRGGAAVGVSVAGFGVDDRDKQLSWFTCPQLKCQPAPTLADMSRIDHFASPAPFDLLYATQLDDVRPAGLLHEVCMMDMEGTTGSTSIGEDHGGSWQGGGAAGQLNQQQQLSASRKLPLMRATNRKCRMARKRRALPCQVPLHPACSTTRKSVEELISEKNLVFLLQKQLKPSDVGNLGRIVLPKKEAESTLPYLTVREGMTIIMEDLTTAYKWHMRYRFWPNNKSRMYLLENTGEFVRSHCLREGDLLRLYKYRDSECGKYVILGKKASGADSPTLSRPRKDSSKKSSTSSSYSNKSKREDGLSGSRNKCSRLLDPVVGSSSVSASVATKALVAFDTFNSNNNMNNSSSSSSSFDVSADSSASSAGGSCGLANFDTFEASDIQEILTSLG